MIKEIHIENFKSIEKLTLPLGQVTVLIGENGSGKSNILEGITFLAAASTDKLDREFLVSRGVRFAEAPLMMSAFASKGAESRGRPIILSATPTKGMSIRFRLSATSDKWVATSDGIKLGTPSVETKLSNKKHNGKRPTKAVEYKTPESLMELFKEKPPTVTLNDDGFSVSLGPISAPNDISEDVVKKAGDLIAKRLLFAMNKALNTIAEKELKISRFIVYAPENTQLRRFEEEGQIQPVGVRGEGLFKMLESFAKRENARLLRELKKSLELIGWFVDFSIPKNLAPGEHRIRIHDRYLDPTITLDQRSANEGFLFLLFYFAVILSPESPHLFAIDNIDASLNPKLCSTLMSRICQLAKQHEKQIILTTHNPAILDGLSLFNKYQRLYAVYRNEDGRTRARRIPAPKAPPKGRVPLKLSEAFSQGLLGALPKGF